MTETSVYVGDIKCEQKGASTGSQQIVESADYFDLMVRFLIDSDIHTHREYRISS